MPEKINSHFQTFQSTVWEGRAAWWTARLLISWQRKAGSKIHISLALPCDPLSPNRPHLPKFPPPPNCKLYCDSHLITPWLRSESSRYNHFHEVQVHLDEDFNKRIIFWRQFETHTKTEATGSHALELKSHKTVTSKFSLKEEQKLSDKDGRGEKESMVQRPWGNREQGTFHFSNEKIKKM